MSANKDDEYNDTFFSLVHQLSTASATAMVPMAMSLVRPKRVVDVGCGTGSWLRVFKEHGCEVLGYDGDYVKPSTLVIDPSEFRAADLSLPLHDPNAPYDLAISLEVAEHIAPECADIFVASLTRLAPVIMFSAAIPGQGGWAHVNEQWPAYWVGKFAQHGYVPKDCLRPQLWDNDKISWFYIQNTLMFVRQDALNNYPELLVPHDRPVAALNVIHPRMFAHHNQPHDYEKVPIRQAIRNFFLAPWYFVLSLKGFIGRRMSGNKPTP